MPNSYLDVHTTICTSMFIPNVYWNIDIVQLLMQNSDSSTQSSFLQRNSHCLLYISINSLHFVQRNTNARTSSTICFTGFHSRFSSSWIRSRNTGLDSLQTLWSDFRQNYIVAIYNCPSYSGSHFISTRKKPNMSTYPNMSTAMKRFSFTLKLD